MTVANQTYKVQANGNDVATVFSFSPMVIIQAADLVVTVTDVAGTDTVVTEGTGTTNYSVSVTTYPGTGSVTYPATLGTELATGETITIKRVLTMEQLTDLENQGGYFAEVQETAFDRLTMIDLQQQEEIDRVLKVPVSDAAVDLTIPTIAARAGKVLAFDAAGLPIASEGVASIPISAFVATIVDDVNAAAVRTTIELGALAVLDTVSATEIDALAVTTAKIAANAVTLTELEDGTQGDILYYGAAGAPARLGTGTVGQVLQAGGAGANPSWTAATSISSPTTQIFTASDTYTKPANLLSVIIEVVSGGGGGGGSSTTGRVGGGGGGGGYARKLVAAGSIASTETVTIGAGGTAGASTPAAGGTGGTTSFGAHCSATGGTGGNPDTGGFTHVAGGVGSSGDLNMSGQSGGRPSTTLSIHPEAGRGGDAAGPYGGSGGLAAQATDNAGPIGENYGGGGGGASAGASAQVGGVGAAGLIIVTEFYAG